MLHGLKTWWMSSPCPEDGCDLMMPLEAKFFTGISGAPSWWDLNMSWCVWQMEGGWDDQRPKSEPASPLNPRGMFLSMLLSFGVALVGDTPRSVAEQRGWTWTLKVCFSKMRKTLRAQQPGVGGHSQSVRHEKGARRGGPGAGGSPS